MHFDLWIAQLQTRAIALWQGLTPDDRYNLWAASGGLVFLLLLWLSHLVMRKALGHRKFRGTWYNEQQFETLIKLIDEDNARGNRVMTSDEMEALRRWRFGSAKNISQGAKGYFCFSSPSRRRRLLA